MAEDPSPPSIDVTRRQALKAAGAVGVLQSIGLRDDIKRAFAEATINIPAETDPNDIHIETESDDPDPFRGNFPNPVDGEYIRIGGDASPIMSLYDVDADVNDNTLYAIHEIAINGSDFYETGRKTFDINGLTDGETVDVYASDLWSGYSSWDAGNSTVDMAEIIDDSLIADYSDFSIPEETPQAANYPNEPISKSTTLTMRYKFQSNTLDIDEKETRNATITVAIHLGFGQAFGVNFGKGTLEGITGTEVIING